MSTQVTTHFFKKQENNEQVLVYLSRYIVRIDSRTIDRYIIRYRLVLNTYQ